MLGLEPDFYQKADVHIHVPEGATPKDGPSAGIGMCTALVSALTKVPVRSDVAMTGEITLRGQVLPIGGLKEKLLAAHRGGIRTVLIPDDNTKDLAEIPQNIKDSLEIKPVKWIDEVLQVALTTHAGADRGGSRRRRAATTSRVRGASRSAPASRSGRTEERQRVDRAAGRLRGCAPSVTSALVTAFLSAAAAITRPRLPLAGATLSTRRKPT